MPLIHSCLPTEREWRRRDLAGFKLLWRSSVDVEWPENAIVYSIFRFSAQSLLQMDWFFSYDWGVFAWTIHTHVHQRGTALTCGYMCFCYHMWGIPWFPHSCFCFFCFHWNHKAARETHRCFKYFIYGVQFPPRWNITEVKHIAWGHVWFPLCLKRPNICKQLVELKPEWLQVRQVWH